METDMKHRLLIAAIDEAIEHESDAEREYRAKAKLYNLPIFNTLADVEKKHEQALRALRDKVVAQIDRRKGGEPAETSEDDDPGEKELS